MSFTISDGETLGLVGESGCGKSTTGKLILRLQDPSGGTIRWRGRDIDRLGAQCAASGAPRAAGGVPGSVRLAQSAHARCRHRRRAAAQYGELTGAQLRERVAQLFARVGLRPDQMVRYPYEFSGGQRQRLGIARALSVQPKLIVCDEPVSALDVSVQAQVINLLMDLQREYGLSYLFVAHDLAVVEHISHRVAVMYLGKIVELAPKRTIFTRPQHPYTEALLEAVPVPDPSRPRQRRVLVGRRAEPDPPAVRLPFPHALSLRVRPLPHRGAAAAGGRGQRHGRAVGRVSSAPAGRRGAGGGGRLVTAAARALRNPSAAGRDTPYGDARAAVLDATEFAAALAEVASWPGYAATPLVRLDGLARALNHAQLLYKDERGRFARDGLKSFKALGGAYAVANLLRRKLADATGVPPARVRSRDLLDGARSAQAVTVAGATTVTCATDGNHGRSVAWGARLFGCRCVIFVHEHVSQGRRDAIARYGAEVREVPGNYDDAVRAAAATAAAEGWTVVSDTSYPGYRDIPRDVMHGYGVMAAEIEAQLAAQGLEPPTHVLVQAGVGALAAAICAHFWLHWGARRPQCVVVEPLQADCVFRSLAAGRPVVVDGALDTVMAGLACGEVSELAWEILHAGCDAAVAIDDAYAIAAVRRFAQPAAGDPPIVAGETGGAGLAALLAAQDHADVRATLRLDGASRVLLLGSEGDTDPDIYRRIVGRAAADVAPVCTRGTHRARCTMRVAP